MRDIGAGLEVGFCGVVWRAGAAVLPMRRNRGRRQDLGDLARRVWRHFGQHHSGSVAAVHCSVVAKEIPVAHLCGVKRHGIADVLGFGCFGLVRENADVAAIALGKRRNPDDFVVAAIAGQNDFDRSIVACDAVVIQRVVKE